MSELVLLNFRNVGGVSLLCTQVGTDAGPEKHRVRPTSFSEQIRTENYQKNEILCFWRNKQRKTGATEQGGDGLPPELSLRADSEGKVGTAYRLRRAAPHPLSAPTLRSCPFLLTSSNRLNEVRFKRAGLHLLKDTGRKHQLENWIRRGFTFQSLRNTELEKKCTYDHFVQIILEGTWYNGVNGVQ